jgi:glucokinase
MRLAVADFAAFEDAVARYLSDVAARPRRAVLAVAAPVQADVVRFTNSPWHIDAAALRARFGFTSVGLINDFAAMSAAVPQLAAADLQPLGPLAAPDLADGRDRVLGVIGPGTGLGVGLLLQRGGHALVVETEGGHASFAPASEQEVAVLRLLWRRHGQVSNERLICGPGLVNLYGALAEIAAVAAPLSTPEAIVGAARAGGSPLAVHAVEMLCELLGGVAGDLVLTAGAWDGVYLAGGLVEPLLPWLECGRFRQRFEAKGRRAPEMARVPVLAILRPDAGLLGASAWAVDGLVAPARGMACGPSCSTR